MSDRPPPYFPQTSLMPPDPSRYRKNKLMALGCLVLVVVSVIGLIVGIFMIVRSI